MAVMFTMRASINDFVSTGLVGAQGTLVHFYLNIRAGELLRAVGSAPMLIDVQRVTGYIRSDGKMYDRPAVTAAPFDIHDPGSLGVRLIANDPAFELDIGVSYTVAIEHIWEGRRNMFRSFSTPVVPSVDTVVDLASLTPGPGLPATGISEGGHALALIDDISDATPVGKALLRTETTIDPDYLPDTISGMTTLGHDLLTAANTSAARSAIDFKTGAAQYRPMVDLRDWDAIRNGVWKTSLGAVYNSGSPLLQNINIPFTSADVGKIAIISENHDSTPYTRWMATIVSVDGSGIATLSANAPSSATNQRVAWGFDTTTAINSALASLAAPGDWREAYLPGYYRATQIAVPLGITLRGGGWASYGGAAQAPAGTMIAQLPGAQKNLLTFSGWVTGSGLSYMGPVGVSDMLLQGPEVNVRGITPTIGHGFALTTQAGYPLVAIDGCEFRRIHTHRFPQSGFFLGGGGLPITMDNCRAFYNGEYGFDCGTDTYNASQVVHLLNCSADGNINGAARFRNMLPYQSVVVTAFKSEADDSATYGAVSSYETVSGWPGVGDTQMSALIFEDCDDTAVVVNGLSHIYGGGARGAGPAIKITSATTKVPRITYAATVNRVRGTETGSTDDAVTLRDTVNSVDIPRTSVSGSYPVALPDTAPDFGDRLTVGQSTASRRAQAGSATMTSGLCRLAYFTATKTETIIQIRTECTTAQSGATLCRIGLWTVDSNGGLTALVASTANDTSLWSSTGVVAKSLSASYGLVRGQRYAVGALIVGSSAGVLLGTAGISTTATSQNPRLSGFVSSLSDLPSTVAYGSVSNSGLALYADLLP